MGRNKKTLLASVYTQCGLNDRFRAARLKAFEGVCHDGSPILIIQIDLVRKLADYIREKMTIRRREVLKAILATAAGGVVWGSTTQVAHALTTRETASPLIWFNEGGSTLNLLAIMGQQYPEFTKLISVGWNLLEYDPVMPTIGKISEKPFSRAPILILESIPPTGREGNRFNALLKQAKATILVGSDACFGGVLTSKDAVNRLERLCKTEQVPLIKIPGVPVPPHHLIGTVGHLEFFGFPRLDGLRRPIMYYGKLVCQDCERRDDFEIGRFAIRPGEDGCFLELGCKGPITYNSCSTTLWNGGENWCVGAGGVCTGCSEPGFPDHGGLGLAGSLKGGGMRSVSPMLRHIEIIGWSLLGVVAAGIGVNRVRAWLAPRVGDETHKPHVGS